MEKQRVAIKKVDVSRDDLLVCFGDGSCSLFPAQFLWEHRADPSVRVLPPEDSWERESPEDLADAAGDRPAQHKSRTKRTA